MHQSTLANSKIWQPAIATEPLRPLVPNSLQPICEVNPVTSLYYRAEAHLCDVVNVLMNTWEVHHHPSTPNQITLRDFLKIYFCAKVKRLSFLLLCSTLIVVVFLPPYGFLLFSLLVVFFLQVCLISLIPGVVQVLCYQAIVGSQPILLNILEKTESFLLFGAHHSSSVSTAFW